MKKIDFVYEVCINRIINVSLFIIIHSLYLGLADAQDFKSVKLKWLDNAPPEFSTGVSWGVPFPEGKIDTSAKFILKDESGKTLPLQFWPLAYWPDGTLKWIGLSTVVTPSVGSSLHLMLNEDITEELTKQKVIVNENDNDIEINTGVIECRVPKSGTRLIKQILYNNKLISSSGSLICLLQNGSSKEYGEQPSIERFVGMIEKVTIEQNGPVRAVIKIEGKHHSESRNRSWLPFIVRLYFYAGQQSMRIVHTIIYDGDQNVDFIKGLGFVFDIPLDEQLYNRHIRFSGDNGRLWDEPCQPLSGRYPLDRREEYYDRQLRGLRIPEPDSLSKQQQFLINNWASWNDYKLIQLNADGFRILKRTNDKSTWIDAGYGNRASGLAFVGDVSGGLTVCLRDFWQSFPSAFEISDVKKDIAHLKTWLWTPDAEAMDMRHYDTLAWGHNLDASYEDVQPGFSIATGVARTSELVLFLSDNVPSYETLHRMIKTVNQPPLLVATPDYLHSIPVFGVWSLPDKSNNVKCWIENQLENAFKYYQLEVEQRHWYGFWHYGDIQHSYDRRRHTWKYDMGGFAWANTELMPNLWLWYSFLRTGRSDIFRMAEAMTRHNSEVDVYHLGPLKGLGSRHNVVHWGCGAKEVRISQAALNRFYYYLTTDERLGDIMHEVTDAANEAIGRIDPLRLIKEKSNYPTHVRFGPDWLALVGNWMTEWERTGDTIYRNRIMTGINSLYEMPYGFFSGKDAAFGYDPETYKLYRLNDNDIGSAHLSVLMGGPEVAFELTNLLKNEKWNKLWNQFCKLYGAPVSEIEKEFGKKVELGTPGSWYARLPAWYAKVSKDSVYAVRAWEEFLDAKPRYFRTVFNITKFDSIQSLQPVCEVQGVSTNNTVQWCLNAIELLELVGDKIPESIIQKFSDSLCTEQYQIGDLLYSDDFENGLNNWIVETKKSPFSKVGIINGKLSIDVEYGTTIWFKEKLEGNLLIEYKRKVIVDKGYNDRLSDLNQFWMALDPRNKNLFTRDGTFSSYDSLCLYYAGIGGNSNTTTRFRKYQGNGQRTLIYDFNDEKHLLQPNKTYFIQIVVYNGTTSFFVDGNLYFSYKDSEPLTEGYFGFRTVKSHQEVDDFKVYRLK
ncbi:exo-rhamnogalacturonan lyase family protein [Melioribacter sp. OK-6-Me]|uniref:exo-rhamnogalacturonan lyase family protein n=1 Tax=unclassified Melioribacter TaxID=2627329 RepID=UPI003ED94612